MSRVMFAWTYPAVLAGAKTSARVPWTAQYVHQYAAGTLAVVYGRGRRRGGRPLAVVRFTHDPVAEPLGAMADGDYESEGWRWLHEHRELLTGSARASDYSWGAFERWRARPGSVMVLRFELVALVEDQVDEALAAAVEVEGSEAA